MNVNGIGKILLWLAPVLIAIVIIILSLQKEQKKEIENQVNQFNKKFAQMNKEMSLNSEDKQFWDSELIKAQNKEKQIEIELLELQKKNDEILQGLEKEFQEADIDEIIKQHKDDSQ